MLEILIIWIIITTINDKIKRKKWEQENADKKKIKEMVEEKEAATTSTAPIQQDPITKTQENTTQSTQPTDTIQTEKVEESTENKENLVDKEKKIKMVD